VIAPSPQRVQPEDDSSGAASPTGFGAGKVRESDAVRGAGNGVSYRAP
jgi:hypothetical protein